MQTTSKDLFEILVREHAPALRAFLRAAIRDSATVDDLFQETLLVAWKNIDSFDRRRPFGPWLRGIAGKLVMAHYRRDARRFIYCDEEMLAQLESRMEAVSSQSGDTFDEKLNRLRECIEALPEGYREAVKARYTDELKGNDLVRCLNLSAENVKKRLQRARQRLLECLERKLVPRSS